MSIRNVVLFTLLLTLSLFVLACQKHDQPVAPQVLTQVQPIVVPEIFRNVTNATGTIIINAAEVASIAESAPNPPLQDGEFSSQFLKLLSLAPNPESQNLALQAAAAASSYWPWIPPGGAYLMTPDHANNGNPSDAWQSTFWTSNHWFKLTWGQPVTINRVYITHQPWYWLGQTISGISYMNSSGAWVNVPGSFPIRSGASRPASVDLSFPAVEARGLIVYLNTGPETPHPNWAVFISEIEVYGQDGSLKITAPPTGSVFDLGQAISFVGEKTGNVTNIQWLTNNVAFGTGLTAAKSDLPPGTHTITLSGQVGNSQVSDSIAVGIRPITLEVTIDPTSVMPSQTPLTTSPVAPTTVTVRVRSGNTPVAGHQVQLAAAGVPGTGGHNAAEHGNGGTRPIPDGVYGVFAIGEGVTDAAGVFSTTYTPTRFGGEERITANSRTVPEIHAEAVLTVAVPGLILLPRQDTRYLQIGHRAAHPGPVGAISPAEPNENHWGTQGLLTAIQNLAAEYNEEYQGEVVPLLSFNDMSLRNGGLFDISGQWHPSHNEHRVGRNVDLRVNNLDVEQPPQGLDNIRRTFLWDEIDYWFENEPHEEDYGRNNWHWHLTAEP
ncbi:MAG: hypothetical protein COX52_14555 [Syntrophobacterales bacterium CG23_combo_of_CG06-09_8_20_14_all_48_27]|nr:MAG: hypothetical protein COX52_14555 [Syntrophobacterales bacterium CG23_combo_of_CG06-09_8_20_14_all_48_27]